MRRWGLCLSAFLGLLALAWFSRGGEPFKPGKLPKEEIDRLQPGLTLRYYKPGDALALDAIRVRLAALHVPAGAAHSTLLPAGPFEARLTGLLKLPLKGEYTFRVVTTGDARLSINGQETIALPGGGTKESAAVELVKGYNKVDVVFVSPAKGDATLRVYWTGDGFTWEPLPTDALFTRGGDADLVSATAVRDGRLLFATHGCARCHQAPDKVDLAKSAMPEMQQQATSLENLGRRLKPEFVAKWIADPRSLRPAATMPKALHGPGVGQQAADLAAFLATLGKDAPMDAKDDLALAGKGEKLFFQLGCVTCHHLQDPKQKDSYERLSLYYVGAKFQPAALQAFLKAPQQHYPWTRMPDFKLSDKEAPALAAYLLAEAKGKVEAPMHQGDPGRGAKLFQDAGCVQCHLTKAGEITPAAAVAFPKIPVKGCLADDASARGKAPDFAFAAPQQRALRAFLATDLSSLGREVPAEFSRRQVKLLQCNACHNRDGVPSRWYTVLTDEGGGVQPEYLPHLTWTGEKLHPEWIEKLLAGTYDHRARPWLKARMPAFPRRAAMIPPGLSHEHGFAPDEDPRPKPDAKLAAIGEKLLPQVGGFNCVQCHAVGDQKAVAPFEAEGINLRDAALRLRYSYFSRWMIDPTRVEPTTRMTKFTTDGKTTALTDVLDGDAHRQFEAIWQYMQTLPAKK
jgi:mono/diheme cytochrome c family protein